MPGYREHYLQLDAQVYPSEWLIRALLGKYKNYSSPSRQSDAACRDIYKGMRALDIGYGDGRNLVILKNLGMDVYGVEPDPKIVEHSKKLFPWANLSQGKNCALNTKKDFFDIVIASHSIYYLDSSSSSLKQSLMEAMNCLKAGGFIMFTVPLRDNHTLSEANLIDPDAEKWIIKDSFYGQRNGQIIQTVSSREKLDELLIDLDIRDPRVCEWKVDWWGTLEHSYIVVGRKK